MMEEKNGQAQPAEKKDIFDRIMELPFLNRFEPLYRKHREVLLYLFFGGVTTVISIVSYWLCSEVLGIPPLIANVISWILAVTAAFLTNRTWVFQAEEKASFFQQAVSFYTGRLATLGVEELLLFVGLDLLKLPNMPLKIAGQVILIVLNYVVSKLFVFR